MCGIAGIMSEEKEVVQHMMARLMHRGPDGSGLRRKRGCVLGHTRLSIIDLEGGAQPMDDNEKQVQIVFNGEIYNFPTLRYALGQDRFLTHSDTEVILELFKSDPKHLPQRLDGMFAFAIRNGDEVILGRDPLGIKPLYLGRRNGKLVFASEIKALMDISDHIEEFPPGHAYSTKSGIYRYYQLSMNEIENLDVHEAQAKVLELLEQAVFKRMVADVPVGVFLSGGLDSSLIAALARRIKEPLDTFSVGMAGSPDKPFADVMAKHLGTRHHEYTFSLTEAFDALPEIIYHLESFDAALVRSAIPNFFLARLAGQHVKVALSGEGADELFSGYHYLKSIPQLQLQSELLEITQALHNTNLQRCDRMSMAHGLEVRVPFLDLKLVDYAFRIPVQYKLAQPGNTEKWILRKVAEKLIPASVAWRAKEKFAAGTGLGERMAAFAEDQLADLKFNRQGEKIDGVRIQNKEEFLYYKIFKGFFPYKDIIPLVGRSRSL